MSAPGSSEVRARERPDNAPSRMLQVTILEAVCQKQASSQISDLEGCSSLHRPPVGVTIECVLSDPWTGRIVLEAPATERHDSAGAQQPAHLIC